MLYWLGETAEERCRKARLEGSSLLPSEDGLSKQELFVTRIHMAASVGFHIVFSVIGMAMPFLMAIADRRWRVTGGPVYLTLTRAWSNGVSIFFAIGAVSGTALSFALGHFLQDLLDQRGMDGGPSRTPLSAERFADRLDRGGAAASEKGDE